MSRQADPEPNTQPNPPAQALAQEQGTGAWPSLSLTHHDPVTLGGPGEYRPQRILRVSGAGWREQPSLPQGWWLGAISKPNLLEDNEN